MHSTFASPNAVQQQLVALKVKGLIQLVPNVSRGIVPLEVAPEPKRWMSVLA
jgi:SOS-response transcriptional repressor LexA